MASTAVEGLDKHTDGRSLSASLLNGDNKLALAA